VEGIFTPLVDKLSTEMYFDRIHVDDSSPAGNSRSWNRRCVLALRSGIKQSLKIKLVRGVGRTIVRLQIMEKNDMQRTIAICRDHFDNWFAVRLEERTS